MAVEAQRQHGHTAATPDVPDMRDTPDTPDTSGGRGSVRPRLRKSGTDKMVSGVCGGLGDYFGIDPVLVRLAFVLTTLAGGAGVLAYVVLAIVLPGPETGETAAGGLPARRDPRNTQLAALVLIALGALLLIANLGWLSWVRADLAWPLVLIAAGAAILVGRSGLPARRED